MTDHTEHPDIGVGVLAFLKAAQEKVAADFAAWNHDATPEHVATYTPKLSLDGGKRYVRIVSQNGPGSRAAFGFIDKTTGDVLYAAGWKGPAKNFARGNVFDAQHGTARIRWTGVY
jgi:hypothetical protein